MITLLWWLGYMAFYVLVGSAIFLWINTHEVYREIDYDCRDNSPMVCAVLASMFWPIGGIIWGGIFWCNKLATIGDKIYNRRQKRKEQDEKDKELANRGF